MSVHKTKIPGKLLQEHEADLPKEPGQALRTQQMQEEQRRLGQTIPATLGKKLSAAEAERLVSQAGFSRTTKRQKKGFEIGDSSQAPIPLPSDDIEDEDRDGQPGLEAAQEHLLHNQTVFKELNALLAENPASLGEQSVWEALLEHQYQPTEEHVAKLTQLAEKAADEVVATQTANSSVAEHFGLDIQKVAPAEQLLGLSMVVAGCATAVLVSENNQLAAEPLTQGMANVTREGQQAVEQARSMGHGIQQHLAHQQTFVRSKR